MDKFEGVKKVELTTEKPLQMLEEFRRKTEDTNWIDHSICVGNSAGKIAEKLGLDVEKAKTLGYIHDIGKGIGEFLEHPQNGYQYIKQGGYADEYANVCLTHSFLNNDYMCTIGWMPEENADLSNFVQTHEYTIYEKIINLCDMICTNVNVTLEKRLIDIMIRRGIFENTIYFVKEIQKLKKAFDNMLGFNVYTLFPDILDN